FLSGFWIYILTFDPMSGPAIDRVEGDPIGGRGRSIECDCAAELVNPEMPLPQCSRHGRHSLPGTETRPAGQGSVASHLRNIRRRSGVPEAFIALWSIGNATRHLRDRRT